MIPRPPIPTLPTHSFPTRRASDLPDAGTLPRQPDLHFTFPKCIVVVIHMDATLLHIQPAAPQPIYRQIAEQIRRLVAGGQLAAGALLPSVREVAAAPALNPITVSQGDRQREAERVPATGTGPGGGRGGE